MKAFTLAFAVVAVLAIALLTCGDDPLATSSAEPQQDPSCMNGYARAGGRIDIGTDLYYRSPDGHYQFSGKVIEIASRHLFEDGNIERGIRVQYSDGGTSWLRRNPIIMNDAFVVKC